MMPRLVDYNLQLYSVSCSSQVLNAVTFAVVRKLSMVPPLQNQSLYFSKFGLDARELLNTFNVTSL